MPVDPLLRPIGKIASCYPDRFGIPRQPGLVPAATAIVTLPATSEMRAAVRGLDGFSHVWILFRFHGSKKAAHARPWNPTVRPPRLGGKKRLGVLATRSPDRPNGIGLSAVRLESVEIAATGIRLRVRGGDFLDGTPVLDIKPYLPYADSIPDALDAHGLGEPGRRLPVRFEDGADERCSSLERESPGLRELIVDTLALDPRPRTQHRQGRAKRFGMRLGDPCFPNAVYDIRFRAADGAVTVTDIVTLAPR